LGTWGWRRWSREEYEGKDWTKLRAGRVNVPHENQRMIVAHGDRLYATLSYGAPMSILEATTGNIITTVSETQGTREILVSDGIAVAYTRQLPQDAHWRKGYADKTEAGLVAVDAQTGKVLWQKKIGPIRSLALAIDQGRVVYMGGKDLAALDLKKGDNLWTVQPKITKPRTLLIVDDVVVMQDGARVAAYKASDGQPLWQQKGGRVVGWEADDLFVIDGLVWRGIMMVDDNQVKPVRKSPNALMVGWDLRTGEEKKRIFVKNLRSPEHHHRCYRNKATVRYLISSYEGAEFVDFKGQNHGQNNWLRGACTHGMMPCNGMLYVPPDQCFCQPGAKLLGYAAVTAKTKKARPKPDKKRLKKGPAYGAVTDMESFSDGDWPTFRHDPARSGTTKSAVPPKVNENWKVKLGGKLTAPVAAGGKLFVAATDAHTVIALDMASGKQLWRFTVDGRVDSPPTIYQGMVLFGSSDGHVYCLRASDGQMVWRFLASPSDRRVVCFDQVESVWPVHGSVLIENGVAYFTAGRSTYLDGGIRVWGVEPATGKILHKGLLEGPHRDTAKGERDFAFYILGANSDVLVAQDGFVYMRQKKMTPQLKEIEVPVLSSKGAQDVGLHVFSTSGLLDGSWYNRTFWMYAKRWPGFQLANQAPKTGQLLVVDDDKTYAVRVFYRRNVHSPMFFPGKEGYLLFADANNNEPQIVGEAGSREPVKWLPQSDYLFVHKNRITKLESEAFGKDKMIGYTRAEPPVWAQWLPVRIRAMVKAGDNLFVAGPPDVFDPEDPYAAFEGRKGAKLVSVSAKDGKKLYETDLECPPVFDSMIAADGRLFVSLQDGSVVCLAGISLAKSVSDTIPLTNR
ncbi:MAG: outer membrane protein assembly factor BamB family protein, partial [Planctomycetota bacterium]